MMGGTTAVRIWIGSRGEIKAPTHFSKKEGDMDYYWYRLAMATHAVIDFVKDYLAHHQWW